MLVQAEVTVAPALRRNRQAVALARRVAQAGARRSRELVHVRTGRLKRSIRVVRTEAGWAWGSDVEYALYVEATYPFIAPAVPAAAREAGTGPGVTPRRTGLRRRRR